MNILYDLGIRVYRIGISLASIVSEKARLWIAGRWSWEEKLKESIVDGDGYIWFHCASLGEFEQGRPLIEAIKESNPNQKILISFFSPSGFELRKGYAQADHVCYLPLDTAKNARVFLDIVKPTLAVFVKYDLWLNFIAQTHRNGIPLVLISALVRKESRFLTGMLRHSYRKAFASFSWIFTQDHDTAHLLESFAGLYRISVAGDTRFDRAAQLPVKFQPLPEIEDFIAGRKCIVVGSAWAPDESIVFPVINELRRSDLCWIIAPHEIHIAHIDSVIASNSLKMIKYSELEDAEPLGDVLWIDNIGLLSRLYHYSDLAYIGGGFGAGIHNTQEAAVYGNPVIFGPNFSKFQEAVDMERDGGAKSVTNTHELRAAIHHWLDNPGLLQETRLQNIAYMQSKTGATTSILQKLRLLGYMEVGQEDHGRKS